MLRSVVAGLLAVTVIGAGVAIMAQPADRWLAARPHVVPTEGVLTLNGEPLASAVVTFHAVDGRHSAAGRTDEAGVFHLATFDDGDGAVPGDYRITVNKTEIDFVPDPGAPEQAPPLLHLERHLVPDRYRGIETSGLSATVRTAGRHALALQLEGDPPLRPVVHADQIRPNVIFVLADDLGYGDLGCFGQPLIETPHLDRLAAEGMRFTQAYAGATVCAPSRCALMTGLHGGHASIRGNRELPDEGQSPMPAGTRTAAHLMQSAGYSTGLIGKWGLGFPGSHSTPMAMGFDEFFGYNCQRKAHEYYPDSLWRNDEKVPLDGRQYSHDLLATEALQFVRKHHKHPFFLEIAFTIPHAKLQVPDLGRYADRDWSEREQTCAAMISRMDHDVGRLMSLLKELEIDERTLVVFASDNGAAHRFPRFRHSGPLRGFKRDLYEGGIRTPAIARWPGRIPPGVVSPQIWAFWDLLPTLAELTGQPIPEGLDGVSVLPALLQNRAVSHPPLYFEFHERGFSQAARIDDWKGVRTSHNGPLELYDLAVDPGELHNIAEQHPEVVARLDEFLRGARVDSELWPIQAGPTKRAGRR